MTDAKKSRIFGAASNPWCPARVQSGSYGGYRCCAQEGHDGDHAITNGSVEPPYYTVVYEWPKDEGMTIEFWARLYPRGEEAWERDHAASGWRSRLRCGREGMFEPWELIAYDDGEWEVRGPPIGHAIAVGRENSAARAKLRVKRIYEAMREEIEDE